MAYIYKNPNPIKNLVGDCVIRGISILTDTSWEYTYDQITKHGQRTDDVSNRRDEA